MPRVRGENKVKGVSKPKVKGVSKPKVKGIMATCNGL